MRKTCMYFTLLSAAVLASCGRGGGDVSLNTDYSALRPAASTPEPLVPATSDEQVLRPLRNGLRLALIATPVFLPGVSSPTATQDPHSTTTVQVEGVDEADPVKYDGRYIYSVRPASVPPMPGLTRNVLKIVRTDPATAGFETISEFDIDGRPQSTQPLLYLVEAQDGAAQYVAVVTQNYEGWFTSQPQLTSLVAQPDRTTVQLLDVRDPYNVSSAWKIEIDGWLRASRKIDQTLYLVSSYRPRLANLMLPADTQQVREANELRIRNAGAQELLPGVRENGAAARELLAAGDCVVAAGLGPNDAYSDLLVITAVDLDQRRVTDASCLSTNVNGVFVSRDSLYVGGEGAPLMDGAIDLTVLHRFGLAEGRIGYRASGAVIGRIGWTNPSYFMDEHAGDLRIVTTRSGNQHRLSVLREIAGHVLAAVATLPDARHPEPIGKPGEQVFAVRFAAERAYVVTARRIDPLYVIDLANPTDPFIAGSLEIPGFATYLKPLRHADTQLLLSIGEQTSPAGRTQGIKVELFDVTDLAQPRSIGVQVFGQTGSFSDAVSDPHALTLVTRPEGGERFALPISVFETPYPGAADQFKWTYSGAHLLEVTADAAPQLRFHGVIKTAEADGTVPYAPYVTPQRSVLHDDSVFVVDGDRVLSAKWTSF
ncbi:MAG TPA: beta-propeller domain-containing protein [Povalibacter sp.]|nr:beta-propeller domain-containing protein [Povalibacter sp.]